MTGCYEQLRGAVIGGQPGWRLGAGVLSARGMSAWIRVTAALPPVGRRSPLVTPPAVPSADAVVGVLAAMTLACHRRPNSDRRAGDDGP